MIGFTSTYCQVLERVFSYDPSVMEEYETTILVVVPVGVTAHLPNEPALKMDDAKALILLSCSYHYIVCDNL